MSLPNTLALQCGRAEPYGSTVYPDGVNFSLYSRSGESVTLCLFSDDKAIGEIVLDPLKNRTGQVWHIFIGGLPKNCTYCYRIQGGAQPLKGEAFDPEAHAFRPLR